MKTLIILILSTSLAFSQAKEDTLYVYVVKETKIVNNMRRTTRKILFEKPKDTINKKIHKKKINLYIYRKLKENEN